MTIELDPKASHVQQIWNSPQLAIIVPTFNERDNVVSLFELVSKAMGEIPFEFIVVDDNSPDGTAGVVKELARRHANVRCIHRIGRRGLSSAVIEGISASAAPYFAVIDADHQHDERNVFAVDDHLALDRAHDVHQLLAQRLEQCVEIVELVARDFLTQRRQNSFAGLDADIGGDQANFELIEHGADPAARAAGGGR